ncbi:hypothetical protein ACU6TU_06775 [Halomonas sp. LS-001]
MKPIFTVHAGEFVFGEHVEKNFQGLRLWVPTKDTGIDFLVTDSAGRKTVSVQVKMSRDYRPSLATTEFDKSLKAAGWFVFSHSALESSPADIWSIILISHERKSKPVFLNVPPNELLRCLVETHGKQKNYHLYPWLFTDGRCIEGRGLKKADKRAFMARQYDTASRDLSTFHENWDFLNALSG